MNQTPTILIIDDDIDLCQSIKALLTQHGMATLIANDGDNIQTLLSQHVIDLILLDIIMPGGKDGIALCKMIRELSKIPIIMLTGVGADVERIISLEIGADNYLTKPFNPRVLIAHINACLRRQNKASQSNDVQLSLEPGFVEVEYQLYEFSGWILNATARVLLSPDKIPVKLTSAEFSLLQAFLLSPQCVLSRNQLLETINTDSDAFDRSVDVLISRLRAKLDANKQAKIIDTERNSGYILICPVTKRTINSKDWQDLLSKSIPA